MKRQSLYDFYCVFVVCQEKNLVFIDDVFGYFLQLEGEVWDFWFFDCYIEIYLILKLWKICYLFIVFDIVKLWNQLLFYKVWIKVRKENFVFIRCEDYILGFDYVMYLCVKKNGIDLGIEFDIVQCSGLFL